MNTAATAAATAPRHRVFEDVQALATGSALAALGMLFLQHAGLVPGGTVGLSLVLTYVTGWPLPLVMVLANAPFYVLAYFRLGPAFAAKTVAAVSLAAVFAHLLPMGLGISRLSLLTGAVLGGLLCGVAILVLFRHQASLGGLNIVALYAQNRFGFSAGKVQMAIDSVIVLGAGLLVTDPARVATSVLATIVVNLVLAVNHRPGRYRVT